MPKSADELFIEQALELARAGVGLASPNPCVGAVVVDERGRIVGRGTHTYDGVKHAEVLALEEAGEHARGNTLYVTLEPCSHSGPEKRNSPCADAVISAGISRVVASMPDPNPKVSGRGFEKLRAAGIEVEVGVRESEAWQINEAWAKYIRTGVPFVLLKGALSIDGYISPSNKRAGEVFYLIGEKTKAAVQEVRHAYDAIMVGIGTVLADDPSLTDRSGKPRRRKLQRVVLDTNLRTPLESNLVTTCDNDVIIFTAENGDPTWRAQKSELEQRGVRIEVVAKRDNHVDIVAALNKLGELKITSVLTEGGAHVNSAMLSAGLVDKLWLLSAPMLFGGGVRWLADGIQKAAALTLHNVTSQAYGSDVAISGYVHR